MNTYLIKKKEDFAHVFRNGSFLNCSSFTINYAKKSKLVSANSPRFGIIASKKVGNAVQRNFAKRGTNGIVWEGIANAHNGEWCSRDAIQYPMEKSARAVAKTSRLDDVIIQPGGSRTAKKK